MPKEEIANVEIILYALYLKGGEIKKVHTEDIALECFKLSQSRFSWIKYPKYPSLEAVRRPLIGARLKNGGGLVSGRHGKTKENQVSDGWIFTPNGINWIEKNKAKIESLLGAKQKPIKRTQIDKQIFEFKSSIAFKKFLKNKNCGNIQPYEFTDFLNASIDTPSSILRDRVDKIRAIAAKAKEEKIINFINKAEQYFFNIL